MADQINYYQVLGVPREASQEEIRAAYRTLAKDRHPDRAGGSTEEFSLLQEAHAVAHAADQLAGLNLDFDSVEDELATRRQQRESGGPSLGERFRGRFGREEKPPEAPTSGRGRRRGGYEIREARWYEPHDFDPEPITWRTGPISFVVAFLAFIAVGQLGLWATSPEQVDPGPFAFATALAPFMP